MKKLKNYKNRIFVKSQHFDMREFLGGESMRAIDSPPKNRRFAHKNPKMSDFSFKTSTPSLNQVQGSVFTIWEYAQSISRMILLLK